MFLPFLKRVKGGGGLRFLNINLYLVSPVIYIEDKASSTYKKIMKLWKIFTTSLGEMVPYHN